MPSEHRVEQVSAPGGLFAEHPVVGRRLRGGDWPDQGVATSRLIVAAARDGRGGDAAELARHFVVEADVCHRLYGQWLPDLREFLRDNGVSDEDLSAAEDRIVGLLRLPDASPWDRDRVWDELLARVDDLCADLDGGATDVVGAVDGIVETWRRCHDRDVDHISGLMDLVVTRLGELAIGPMYDAVLRPWFDARYSQFDVDRHDWAEALTLNMLVAFEAMRGHLCGPGRRGDVGFQDLPDRYVLTFDPCGSGGRVTSGDEIEGTPPRPDPPYGWPVTREPAPWNHGRPGVCVYCTHCIVLTEIMPTDAYGYPVRAVDPPRYGEQTADGRPATCSWTMFKDPGDVPDEYYRRIGRSRPAVVGSRSGGARTWAPPGRMGT